MPYNTSFKAFLKDRFNLSDEQAGVEEVIQSIRQSIYFRGTNLWVLIFAIFLASIGLNMNSTAVIIGAMLISPLMGPIMGIGLGAGINDFRLIRTSAYNYSIAVIISLCASTLYFVSTPLAEAHSELLARTTPTVYDVLIAFFGGLAGVIATSSKSKGNVIPGVAIATALMPPLCTAGYGLAVGNMYYFAGALYLFFINSVFICLATFLMVRFLHFPLIQYKDEHTAKKVKLFIYTIVIITLLPSIYIAYQMIQRNVFESNSAHFINKELNFNDNTIIERKISASEKTISLVYIGKGVSNELLENAKKKMPDYHLMNAKLLVKQGVNELNPTEITSMKSEIVEELYTKTQEILAVKEEKIQMLEQKLKGLEDFSGNGTLIPEIKVLFPLAEEVSVSKVIIRKPGTKKSDTAYLAYLKVKRNPDKHDMKRIKEWLQQRLTGYPVRIVIDK